MSKHVDCVGMAIKEGDIIAYAAHRGQSVAIRFGLVKELKWLSNKVDGWPKLSCVVLDQTWRNPGKWEVQKKKVSLQVAAVLVLHPAQVNPHIRDLLLGAVVP